MCTHLLRKLYCIRKEIEEWPKVQASQRLYKGSMTSMLQMIRWKSCFLCHHHYPRRSLSPHCLQYTRAARLLSGVLKAFTIIFPAHIIPLKGYALPFLSLSWTEIEIPLFPSGVRVSEWPVSHNTTLAAPFAAPGNDGAAASTSPGNCVLTHAKFPFSKTSEVIWVNVRPKKGNRFCLM